MKPISSLFLLLILGALASCRSYKNVAKTETTNKVLPPKLIFLNYKISKDDSGNKNIEFINKIVADGKQKNNNNQSKLGTIGDLKCSQLDQDSAEIESIIIKNPFIKQMEIVNDSLLFENKTIEIRQTPLSIRLQLHNKRKFIAVNKIIDTLQYTKSLYITKID